MINKTYADKCFNKEKKATKARTDVKELARRLNSATQALKEAAFLLDMDSLLILADELEAPLRKKK